LTTQSVGRVMRVQGSGTIINLITHSPHTKSTEAKAAFLASMSGLDGFTHQAARELRPYGIHVYAVEDTQETVVETIFALLDVQVEER
jgi:NAD(P)-dependent dehydrogenase (short-subunit alcohol dehydrogenase family)